MNHSQPIKLVVVDDQRDFADALVELLAMEGFDARAAYDGQEVIGMVATFGPECILFDISMPGLDGLQLAKQLRASHGDDIVLMAMTGDVEGARVADTFRLVDHYFQKPFELKALLRILRPRP